jgi:phosphatidylserine/phosphatidylglycerophosphate/cardiolipin synthase-like enzyme
MNKAALILLASFLLSACATAPFDPQRCPAGTQKRDGCPPLSAIEDSEISELYLQRASGYVTGTGFDPVEYARTADIPISHASARFVGSTDEGALQAMASRIWMIENAEHTIDIMYYILREDLAGFALLGAVCEAVQRGVDARLMIDGLGSSDFGRNYLRALASCAAEGGFIRNREGVETVYKARAQAAQFNSTSSWFANPNRRSHDKLIVKDGVFAEKAYMITGGRNVSLDYFGFTEDGDWNTHTYRDSDIIVRGTADDVPGVPGIGDVSDAYYTLLFAYEKNKHLDESSYGDSLEKYREEREMFAESLAHVKALPRVQEHLAAMDEYMTKGFYEGRFRLAHNLGNMNARNVVTKAEENLAGSPNSVIGILNRLRDLDNKHVRIVSPYLFAAYYKVDGEVTVDEAADILEWLDENPESQVTIVTNSVITGDNFITQSVIDVNLVPRLLLSEEMQALWAEGLAKGEENPELVQSPDWLRMVNHPRLHIYETGRTDDVRFGGDRHYTKLHAKYIIGDSVGFVGTTNFDYRSRLYNSEMGYFFDSEELVQSIIDNTDYLIGISYRWGSPEWLEMRRLFRETDGTKAFAARHQRGIYKTVKNTGLIWWF